MGNFFRELSSAEKTIIESLSSDCTDSVFRPETKAILVRLIQSVTSGKYFPNSEACQYICKNFRYGASELAKLYNDSHNTAKAVSTFRSQISVASDKLYGLFGRELYQTFISQNEKKLQRIDNSITLLELKDYDFSHLFSNKMSNVCAGYNGTEFALSECTLELNFLKQIVHFRLLSEMYGMNIEKFQYLKYILDEPMVDYKDLQINKKKASILVALGVPTLVLENTT